MSPATVSPPSSPPRPQPGPIPSTTARNGSEPIAGLRRKDLSSGQAKALLHILRGKNVLVTGGAGSGKSAIIPLAIQGLEANGKKVAICAPTGLAALNIGGTTIHSLFGFQAGPCVQAGPNGPNLVTTAPPALRAIDSLLIDEASLLRMDLFDSIVLSLQKAGAERGKPIQLVLFGDMHQLAPVVQPHEVPILEAFYGKGFGNGYAFEGLFWRDCDFYPVFLTEIVRQKNPAFIASLNKVRTGDPSGLDFLNQNATVGSRGSDALCLFSRNKDVDRTNRERLDALRSKAYIFPTVVSFEEGHDAQDVGRHVLNAVPPDLVLKEGARVMFTCNDHAGNRSSRAISEPDMGKGPGRHLYANGMMGTVSRIRPGGPVTICLDHNGALIETGPVTVPLYTYAVQDGRLQKVRAASYQQLPLRLAYSISIHRAQGQTLERACLNPSTFAPGQLYVGLSRCTTVSGLSLTRPILEKDLIVDPAVLNFYASLAKGGEPRPALKQMAYVPLPLIEHVQREVRLMRPIDLICLPPYAEGRRHMRIPDAIYEHVMREKQEWAEAVRKDRRRDLDG